MHAIARRADPSTVASTARAAHSSPCAGRPVTAIKLASDVAARAPISVSVTRSCASHAASRRCSAVGDPVKTPSSPSSASQRALETWHNRKTLAAADVSAALSSTEAASSSRRSRSAASTDNAAACSIAHAAAAASPAPAAVRAASSSSVASWSSGPSDAATKCANRDRPPTSSAARACRARRRVGLRSP